MAKQVFANSKLNFLATELWPFVKDRNDGSVTIDELVKKFPRWNVVGAGKNKGKLRKAPGIAAASEFKNIRDSYCDPSGSKYMKKTADKINVILAKLETTESNSAVTETEADLFDSMIV